MKVVFFVDNLLRGGTQRALTYLVAGLTQRNYEISVVDLVNQGDQEFVTFLKNCKVQIYGVGKWQLVSGFGLILLTRWLRQQRFDVSVSMLFYADLIGIQLSKLVGIPYHIASIRSSNKNVSIWMQWIWPLALKKSDVIVFNSQIVLEQMTASGKISGKEVVVIPNGIPNSMILPQNKYLDIRQKLEISPDSILVGSIGRLSPEKGHDLLIKAVASLPWKIHLILVGSGESEDKLRELARRLNIEERIHFVGLQTNIPEWLAAFDIFALPSRVEGMSNALMEAMAAGCAIVASAVDGNIELIQDGVHGWLFNPDDVSSLEMTLQDALKNSTERQRRGAAACLRVKQNYSISQIVDAWDAVLCRKLMIER